VKGQTLKVFGGQYEEGRGQCKRIKREFLETPIEPRITQKAAGKKIGPDIEKGNAEDKWPCKHLARRNLKSQGGN